MTAKRDFKTDIENKLYTNPVSISSLKPYQTDGTLYALDLNADPLLKSYFVAGILTYNDRDKGAKFDEVLKVLNLEDYSDEKTVTHIEIKKQKPLFKIVDEKILENIKQNNDIDINKRININNIDNIGNKNTNFNNDNVNFNNRYKIEIDEVDLLHQTQEYKIEKLNYKYYINIEIENKLNDLYFIK